MQIVAYKSRFCFDCNFFLLETPELTGEQVEGRVIGAVEQTVLGIDVAILLVVIHVMMRIPQLDGSVQTHLR
jgi:hypothetical protein